MMNSMVLSNFMFGENIDIYSKIVYMGLKKYINKITGTCFPAKKRLAEECGISLSTLNKAIKRLIDSGVLVKDFRYRENKSQTSNLYTLTPFLISGDYYFIVRADIFTLGLKTKEIVVYSYLCSAANQDMECYPSIKTIALACCLSETTIKGTIKELINKKLIEKISQFRADGGRKNNLYKIVLQEDNAQADEADDIQQEAQPDNIFEQPAHEELIDNNTASTKPNLHTHTTKNNLFTNKTKIFNKKIRKEIKKMKVRSDIFNFKLSENSFMVYLYINTCYCVEKPYFPSVDEICTKLKLPQEGVKASLAELQIKSLISGVPSEQLPLGIIETPPWAK